MKLSYMNLIRETYLSQIRPYYDVDLIKVITGVRRAGKSVLLDSIRTELLAAGVLEDHIIYMNFEDMDFEYIENAQDLHEDVKIRIKDASKYYIFLDEIQHIDEFEKALASFRASLNVSIFVTGSNSTLLSGELATLLTGRTVEFEVLPFSYSEMKEFIELNGKEYTDDLIYDYLKWGGFPLRFQFSDGVSVRRYIDNLYESIVKKDIIGKGRNINRKAFRTISLYILANAGKEFSAENIVNYCKSNSFSDISERTVYNYIEKMQKAFLLHAVNKYSISGKAALKSREKYYATDMGFRTINTNAIRFEDAFFLENVIYNELLVRGYTVFTGKTYKGEVDFVAIRNGKKCFIQVAYILADDSTVQREFGAYKPISDASPKYVMSLDRVDFSRDGIAHVNIIDFLLHKVDVALT